MGGAIMPFVPPSKSERRRAIGPSPPAWLEALGTDSHRPMYKPGVDDWNRGREAKGQTYERWRQTSTEAKTKARDKVYLQPLGSFDPAILSPSLDHLRAFA